MELPALNPAQQDVVDLLGAPRSAWPEFDPDLRQDLRTMLDDALAPLAEELGQDTLWVGKYKLKEVHGCEVRFVAEQAGFVPSAATARGTVTHKAIELTLNLPGETAPLDLVDEAIARLQDSDAWLAEWLRTCDDGERAELRGEVNDLLVKFLDCWPPLRPQWRPAAREPAQLRPLRRHHRPGRKGRPGPRSGRRDPGGEGPHRPQDRTLQPAAP